jgi:hypothetical protein
MAATLFEQTMVLVAAALAGAGTVAGTRVYRGLVDELAIEEAPALVLRRDDSDLAGQLLSMQPEHQLTFSLSAVCAGDDWETACDSLHQQAHAALVGTPALDTSDLELRTTSARAQAGAVTVGSITAQYVLTLQPTEQLI